MSCHILSPATADTRLRRLRTLARRPQDDPSSASSERLLARILTKAGVKPTPWRRHLLRVLRDDPEPQPRSFAECYLLLRQSIAPSTLYWLLHDLADAGLVKRSGAAERRTRFELDAQTLSRLACEVRANER